MWSNVWPYLLAILLFGMIIAIHEFGHFAFAKLFKVKVNEFSIGMGPAILKKQKGETLYALRLFPIGGYVSMEGEDESSTEERAFNNKPAWQRFIVVAAGAILNVILGVIVVAICLSMDSLVGTRVVNSFMKDAVSVNHGLEAGDEIVRINGTRVYSYRGVAFNMVRDSDNSIKMTVLRNGKQVELPDVQFKQFEYQGHKYLQQDFYLTGEKPNFLNVTKNAFLDSASIIQMVRLSLVDLCRGKYALKDLSGPVGAISAVAQTTASATTVKDKMLTALTLLAYLTINVGVFNLLPIPALDGGRLFFIVVEMIRRKPINPKKEGYVHTAGLIILLVFMAIVTVSDIIKQF